MKKLLVGLLTLVLLVFLGLAILIISLGKPFDPDHSEYFNLVPPDNLIRTIHNPIAGHFTTFVEKSHETEGAYTLLEIELQPGEGNAPHYHNSFTETFIGVEGSTGVHVNGEVFYLESGESKVAQKGDVHYFFNDTDEVIRFQVRIEPGSPGFEKALYILYGLANDGLTDDKGIPNDILNTSVFVAYSNTRAVGAVSILNPIFDRLAGKAQRTGVESHLMHTYYLSMIDEGEQVEPPVLDVN